MNQEENKGKNGMEQKTGLSKFGHAAEGAGWAVAGSQSKKQDREDYYQLSVSSGF